MKPKRVKEIREHLGLKQAELAELLGVKNRVTITHFETGVRTPNVLTHALLEIFFKMKSGEFNRFKEKLLLEIRIINSDQKKQAKSRVHV